MIEGHAYGIEFGIGEQLHVVVDVVRKLSGKALRQVAGPLGSVPVCALDDEELAIRVKLPVLAVKVDRGLHVGGGYLAGSLRDGRNDGCERQHRGLLAGATRALSLARVSSVFHPLV